MSDIYLARQPIFDRSQSVIGYELLHRSGPENVFARIDSDVASSQTVDRAAMGVGLDELTDGRLAFVNVSRRVLVEEIYTLLPTQRTVIELLENIAPDPEVLKACYRLKAYGYKLALDDFAGDPHYIEMLALADIVKIDLLDEAAPRALKMVEPLRQRGLRLVAEKVETHEMHRDAIENGYDLFQGYFFCRPQMVQTKDVSPNKLNAMRFLSEVCREDPSFERLEEVFRQEVSLSTRLLRYLNSAGFGWTNEITSLNHALRLVGLSQLQKWGAMMCVVTLASDRPQELASAALARARFSEQLGVVMGQAGRELDLFLTGLLSLMDAMVGRPLAEVLSSMTVSDEVRAALVQGGTPLADVLTLVTAYERGDWNQVQGILKARDLEARQVHEVYTGSLRWAREAVAY